MSKKKRKSNSHEFSLEEEPNVMGYPREKV
jgi:hypothetical protein